MPRLHFHKPLPLIAERAQLKSKKTTKDAASFQSVTDCPKLFLPLSRLIDGSMAWWGLASLPSLCEMV